MSLLTIKEAADTFGVHENTIRNWLKKGLLRSHRINPRGQIFINERDLARVINKLERWRHKDEDYA